MTSGNVASRATQEGKGLSARKEGQERRGKQTSLENWLTFRNQGTGSHTSRDQEVRKGEAEREKEEKNMKKDSGGEGRKQVEGKRS